MSEQVLPPTAAPVPAMSAEAPLEQHRFTFTGTGAEYFRVWIVNIALTVVTLGIYSAWAKVRNKQYFYGNATLAGGGFEYTANPVNILKGRIIVLGLFVAYQLAAQFQPIAAFVLALFILPFIPWVIVSAVRFNHRHSAYRNLRFHFDGGYWESFRIYILLTLAIGLSFGLAYPYVVWRRKRFLVERSRYGQGEFSYHAEIGHFFVVYILAGVFYTAVLVGLIAVLGGGFAALAGLGALGEGETLSEEGPASAVVIALSVVAYLGMFVVFIVVNTGIQAAISNYVWSNTRLSNIRFKLDLELVKICWIQLSNLIAIIASIGLLSPWAKVRIARYRLSRFAMLAPAGELDRFVASQRDAITATGDEMGEALDIDLGL